MTLIRPTINKSLCFSHTGGHATTPKSPAFHARQISTKLLNPLSALRVLLGHLSLSAHSARKILPNRLLTLSIKAKFKLSAACAGMANL